MRAVLAIVIVSVVAAASFGGKATEDRVTAGVEPLSEIVVHDVRPGDSFSQEQADEFYRSVVPQWRSL